MNIDESIIERVERYVKGEMPVAELKEFENKLLTDTAYANAVNEYMAFYASFNQFTQRENFKSKLDIAHDALLNDKIVDLPVQDNIVSIFRRNFKLIGIAASVGLVSILSTALILTNYYKSQAPKGYRALMNEVAQIKRSQGVINNKISTIDPAKKPAVAGIYSGTSFLITANGYMITSLHIVKDANNIEVVNDGYAYNAKVIASNMECDFALLKIQDSSYEAPKSIPYNFFASKADMGQKVFTLGYPRADLVYGEGSVSSLTGYQDDTIAYQISVPLNPGNSGGPLFDESGNIIGVISGKQMRTEAASFAIKSSYIVEALKSIEDKGFEDSYASYNKKRLANQSRVQQLKTLKSYIFEVRVIN